MADVAVAAPGEQPKKARRTPEQIIAGLRGQAEERERASKERSLKVLREAIELCQGFAAKYPASAAAKTVNAAIGQLQAATQQPF